MTATERPRVEAAAVDAPVVRLAEDQVEDIVDRIVERLAPRLAVQEDGLVDAATIARELGLTRGTVYAHKDELGAIEVGTGSKPRLRFDRRRAIEGWSGSPTGEQHAPSQSGSGKRNAGRPGRSASCVELLPVRGTVADRDAHVRADRRAETIDRS